MSTDVAIVGSAGRFPGAENVAEFWRNLRRGAESISTWPRETCERSSLDPDLLHDSRLVAAAGTLDHIEDFDAAFFGLTASQAMLTDPQHRVFLECAWEALETAGFDPEQFDRSIGVYASSTISRYLSLCLASPAVTAASGLDLISIGNNLDFMTTLVSYKLNLTGPSYAVQTACSSSLVAVHVAVQALLARECELALAGGVSIRVPQRTGYRYEAGGIVSPDGHCRPFDADARGTVFSNGAGVVVLQRLDDALRCGSTIHAVIKGSAINNDGSAKAGFTAPSVSGQSAVIVEAQANAGVPVETIGYVEAHGTGTAVGDPIEIAALTDAFRQETPGVGFCALGSVKANIGHLDAAAGIAGLIKIALMLQHREIPPALNFSQPNPRIDFERSPFYVNRELRRWESASIRRASVSSFGIGGTNAHVVVEEAPDVPAGRGARTHQLLTVSAHTPDALEQATDNLLERIRELDGEPLADAAYTTNVGRKALRYRRAIVCRQGAEAADTQRRSDRRQAITGEVVDVAPAVVFLFPGDGVLDARVGAELYRSERAYRTAIDRCVEGLCRRGGNAREWEQVLIADDRSAADLLKQPRLAQPASFAVAYALAKLWIAWGVEPKAMLGDGVGEYVAACVSDVFALDDALGLVAERGALMQRVASGVEVESSADSMWSRFEAAVDRCPRGTMRFPIVSSLTGQWLIDGQAQSPRFWTRQLREPARFTAALEQLEPASVCLEVGPGHTLRQLASGAGFTVLSCLPSPGETTSAQAHLLGAAGDLWTLGIPIKWDALYAGQQRRRVPLPTYPFERRRYWLPNAEEPPAASSALSASSGVATQSVDGWFYLPSWKRLPKPALASDASARGWIAFLDEHGLGEALARTVERSASLVVRVRPGDRFAIQADGSYVIRPDAADDYEALLAAIERHGGTISHIAHCWGVTDRGDADTDDERRTIGRGFYSLLWLARALDRRPVGADVRLYAITSEAHEVTGDEETRPAAAMSSGVCTVIAQECAGLRCRHIDIPRIEEAASAERWARPVLADMAAPTGPSLVAYRGGHRWAPTFEPTLPAALASATPALRPHGVYLIVGGLGRFGLIAAAYLARTVKARLVLASRSPFPDRSRWRQWLDTHPSDDVTSRRIERLQSILDAGGELRIVTADAGDEAAMTALVDDIERDFGGLNGVIHAAGHTGRDTHRSIHEITSEDCEDVFTAKVAGLAVLARVVAAQARPDFCLLTSSLSPILGGLGLAAYGAAHHYMDALAARMARRLLPWTSVNWEGWARDGSASSEDGLGRSVTDRVMSDAQIERCLELVLRMREVPRIVIATAPLESRIREWVEDAARAAAGEDRSGPVSTSAEPANRRDGRPAGDVDAQAILGIARSILGAPNLGVDDDLFDHGADSLMAVQLISRLRRELRRSIPLADLFAHSSAAALAAALNAADRPADHSGGVEHILSEIEALSQEEAQALLQSARGPADARDADG